MPYKWLTVAATTAGWPDVQCKSAWAVEGKQETVVLFPCSPNITASPIRRRMSPTGINTHHIPLRTETLTENRSIYTTISAPELISARFYAQNAVDGQVISPGALSEDRDISILHFLKRAFRTRLGTAPWEQTAVLAKHNIKLRRTQSTK